MGAVDRQYGHHSDSLRTFPSFIRMIMISDDRVLIGQELVEKVKMLQKSIIMELMFNDTVVKWHNSWSVFFNPLLGVYSSI